MLSTTQFGCNERVAAAHVPNSSRLLSQDKENIPPSTRDAAQMLTSMSVHLMAIKSENDQVKDKAKRVDEMCNALEADLALATTMLEQERSETRQLRLEHDELARQLEELRKARLKTKKTKKDEQRCTTTTTNPITVVDAEDVDLPVEIKSVSKSLPVHEQAFEKRENETTNNTTSVHDATSAESFLGGANQRVVVETALQSSESTPKDSSILQDFSTSNHVVKKLLQDVSESPSLLLVEEPEEVTEDKDSEDEVTWIDKTTDEQKRLQEREKQEKIRAARKKAIKEAEKARRLAAEEQELEARQLDERNRREAREARKHSQQQVSAAGPNKQKPSRNPTRTQIDRSLFRMTTKASISLEREAVASAKKPIPSKPKPSTTAPAQLVSAKLSNYLYPTTTDGGNGKVDSTISPIFHMLQDKSTVKSARLLLQLETKCSRLKREAAELHREKHVHDEKIEELQKERDMLNDTLEDRKNRIEKSVKFLVDKRSKLKVSKAQILNTIKELEAKTQTDNVKEHLKDQRRYLKVCATAEEAERSKPVLLEKAENFVTAGRERIGLLIDESEEKSENVAKRLKMKVKVVERIRDDIVANKLSGDKEDDRFDINDSRDEHGHTFLMVAVLNNDAETAKLCFQLGAKLHLKCTVGLTAMDFVKYFQLGAVSQLIIENGGSVSEDNTWRGFLENSTKFLHPIDWETQLQIAERSAIPADTKLATEEDPTSDDTTVLSTADRTRQFPCFDGSLHDPDVASFRRMVLLEKDVQSWYCETEETTKSTFLFLLRRLSQQDSPRPVCCHRRFVIGVKRQKQFEVLGAELNPSKSSDGPVANDSLVVLYSPFVEAYTNGVANIGVLVWAVTTESLAPRYLSLVESAEFLRHKLDDQDEQFPAHRDGVLELGKDMHLLDLRTTSIFTGSAMELHTVDIDNGDLDRMKNGDFTPPKRLLHHERQLHNAIFRSSKEESCENHDILSSTRPDLSTNLFGGAGTGKTLLLIKKVISEDVGKRILVVSRLPRLISFVKSTVEAERGVENVSFLTYDDMLNRLSRSIKPVEKGARRTFSTFNQVHFGKTTGTGATSPINFVTDFVENALESGERAAMKTQLVAPITLWGGFRVIKSNVKCAETKVSLTEEEYLNLPRSFGLSQIQRKLVYKLYLRYSEWLASGEFKWDEADRVLYIFKHGLSVFSEGNYLSWEERVYQRGEVEPRSYTIWSLRTKHKTLVILT